MANDGEQLAKRLIEVVRPRRRVLTAYSGGVDSTLVAVAARRALGRDEAPAAIGDSRSLPRRELDQARQIAQQLDLKLLTVSPNEQADPNYRANAGDRCYYCKTHLYETLVPLAKQLNIDYIANGTNTDDLGDHRPGLVAADEAQVISPLLEAGLGKQEVYALACHWRLPNADKPAAACLSSRIPFGTPVTRERLAMVEQAEDVLHEMGFRGFRVRHHESVARIELPLEQATTLFQNGMREQIVDRLNTIGYTYVTLDLAGFRSGSGNQLLSVTTNRST